MRPVVIVGVLAWLGSCDGGTTPARSDAPAPREFDDAKSPEAAPPTIGVSTPEPTLPAEPPPVFAGPAVEATAEARKAAVLAVLSGDSAASRYPLVDVDPGQTYSPGLREEVAPRKTLSAFNPLRYPPPTVHGPLDRDIVRRIVRAHIAELRFCHEQRASANDGVVGKLSLTMTIARDGTVARAEVGSNTLPGADGKAVGTCIVSRAKRWKFPGAEAQTEVTQPFEFTKE